MEARLRSRVHSSIERALTKRPETDGGAPIFSSVRHMTILVVANSLMVILLAGLSATPRRTDRILYVAFSPSDNERNNRSRIVAAGGRVIDGTAWPFVYKVAFRGDDGLARLEAGGPVLAFAADRFPICSAPRNHA